MHSTPERDLPKAGFQFILDDIVERLQRGASLRAAVEDILTFGRRADLQSGLESLTPLQAALLDIAPGLPLHAARPAAAEGSDGKPYALGVWSYGRLWLSDAAPADPECRLIGHVHVPHALDAAIDARAAQLRQALRAKDAEMDAFFAACDEEALSACLYEVHETLDHTDPLLLYIGDKTLTNVGRYNNLQARNGASLPDCFFNRAPRMRLQDWTEEERIMVFCLYWLRVAGCRGEEFNARQLSPATLDAYLDQRLRDYRERAPWLACVPAASIADKARLLARYRGETAGDLLTYRWVNGLTFYKEERLVERKALPAGARMMPADLRRYLATSCGVDADAFDSLDRLFEACIARMAANDFACDDTGMHAFERLLQAIVDSAVEATGSDVGLTRGFRDMLRWQQAFAAQSWEDICNWAPGEHYCAVFPSKALQARLRHQPDMLIKMLYACSGRMQFNSWHYTPGHCPRASVPADRHFYLPPRMPDTAIWSDQHHAGHVHAQVRNTIRCPEPILMNGRVYPGLVDLRLFRQSGHAYTDGELFLALNYSGYVRAACQAFADYQLKNRRAVPVTAFGKEWFREHFSASCAAMEHAHEQVPRRPLSTLFRILCRHAQVEQTALIEARHGMAEVHLSYRDLVSKALNLRTALARLGLAPDACVSLWSQRPLHQALAIIAGLANGITIHPLNPGLSASMLEGQLRHARPDLLILDDEAALPEGLDACAVKGTACLRWNEIFGTSGMAEASAVVAALADVAGAADEQAGLLIYTSGTTGEPKGVRLGWRDIAANVRHAIGALGYQPGWVAGSLLPRFHTFTLISDLLPALLLGGRTVLVDSFDLQKLKPVVETFRRHGVQSYSAAPVVFEACSALRAWRDVPSLQFAVAGAAPLKESTRIAYLELFGHPIVPCYGLTETTCFAAISPRTAIRAGSVGLPAGIEVCVMDEHGRQLAAGITGELAMRGPSVIRKHYFRDHEGRFAKTFHDDGWFLSGDIGHIDADGYIYVTGRKKNMVIRGGEKVYLDDLDRCLFDAPGVVDCASIVQCQPGKPDVAWTFIVTADGRPMPRSHVEAIVHRRLTPRYMPDRIVFIERVPRTPSGKAAHRELLALALHAENGEVATC
ncbi:class I adenylate-forming enzyme family protein [Noviherbaspirillum aerium]|uniref:class I adenylate-forming enzyme family protein n=1 Tax=Noviherbaspirillum aerium TaxID=2588497 RepID=UPI00178C6159|nr:class I adenylate-forming enzyme family protein [Noviherbaspirillum aerium]